MEIKFLGIEPISFASSLTMNSFKIKNPTFDPLWKKWDPGSNLSRFLLLREGFPSSRE